MNTEKMIKIVGLVTLVTILVVAALFMYQKRFGVQGHACHRHLAVIGALEE